LGAQKLPGQVICGFSMETQNMLENSVKKLESKNIDMICANNLYQSGAGFGVDTNVITLITRSETVQLPLMTKEEAAHAIISHAASLMD
jgi:phosphopantothenoylcysteine decarboxylase/phosphopantothenate--cysteine ligase